MAVRVKNFLRDHYAVLALTLDLYYGGKQNTIDRVYIVHAIIIWHLQIYLNLMKRKQRHTDLKSL